MQRTTLIQPTLCLVGILILTGSGCSIVRESFDDLELSDYTQCESSTSPQTMKDLGANLDSLERHIDRYGSVTPKTPDVWGQARFTQFREEFEKEMYSELGNFKFIVAGNESRSDQSFFSSATTLSAAIQATSKSAPAALTPISQTTTATSQDPATGAVTVTQTNLGSPSKSPPLQPLAVGDPESMVSSPDKVINRNPATLTRLGFQGSGGAIRIEPSEYLAQKQRYLNLLNQIRRENEGDDTADSPGYSLNLLRIPVSVLPGKQTQIGHAAEVTVTLNPILGDELLPMTYRNLLVNDLQNQLGLPLVRALEEVSNAKATTTMSPRFLSFYEIIEQLSDYEYMSKRDLWANTRFHGILNYINTSPDATADQYRGLIKTYCSMDSDLKKRFEKWTINISSPADRSSDAPQQQQSLAGEQQKITTAFGSALSNLTFANGLDNKTPFPTSQLMDVYGEAMIFHMVHGGYQAFKGSIEKQKYAHLPDVRSFLREQTQSAYEFLKKHPELWMMFCTEQLADAIRSNRRDEVGNIRLDYRKQLAIITKSQTSDLEYDPETAAPKQMQFNLVSSLSWCLIVDAAMFNERLIRDMKETSASKGRMIPGCEVWRPYFLPDPPPDCRQIFRDYVQLRWPIRVFALDPYSEEQNIADSLSTRQEMQLALSVAFTTGKINARNFTRYVRRLEADYETIALNRTQIGFSSGENVFGWRFYPRFQTPDTPSNFKEIFQNQLIGGPNRNALLRQRRLEPGMRECVAIVMMPSFVPYMTLDSSSNWFQITNPKQRVLTNAQALKMSRRTQAILMSKLDVVDANCYLENDYRMLLGRIDQMKARLPFQSLTSPVPTLNNLGGFEMFSNGTSDLAPELFGWYGAPGIDPTAEATTLFLVGDHFSPLHTKVIIGNQEVPANSQKLLSRQVLQVTFKKGAYVVAAKKDASGSTTPEIHIHLATPYGVTPELAVPVAKINPATPPTPTGFTFGSAKLTARYGKLVLADPTGKPSSFFTPTPKGTEEDDLKITWNSPAGTLTSQVRLEFEFMYGTTTLRVPCHDAIFGCVQNKPAASSSAAGSSADTSSSDKSSSSTATAKPDLKEIVIPRQSLDLLVDDLIQQIAALGPVSLTTNPLAKSIKSTKVTIIPMTPFGYVSQSATTSDQLTVTFKEEGACPIPAHVPPAVDPAISAPPHYATPVPHEVRHLDPTTEIPELKSDMEPVQPKTEPTLRVDQQRPDEPYDDAPTLMQEPEAPAPPKPPEESSKQKPMRRDQEIRPTGWRISSPIRTTRR